MVSRPYYFKNEQARIAMKRDFKVYVETFEELLPGRIINSFATGSRKIGDSFMMFKVVDVQKDSKRNLRKKRENYVF